MKSKKSKLIVDYDLDFDLWGFVSSYQEYRIAWYLNKQLNICLSKEDDEVMEFEKGQRLIISHYIYRTSNKTYRLIKNQSFKFSKEECLNEKIVNHDESIREVRQAFLLPEFKDFDYLLLLEDETGETDGDHVLNTLKEIPLIQFVMLINKDKVKSIHNLRF